MQSENRSNKMLSSHQGAKVRKPPRSSTSQTLQAHISKTSLRRIESYEEVLFRLKASVMQVLSSNNNNRKKKQSPAKHGVGNMTTINDSF